MSGSVAAKIKADLAQRTRMRENDKLNDIIAEIGRSVKAGSSVRANVWNELNASSSRFYNAEPRHVGPQTYRPRRAEKIVRRSTNNGCRFASASRHTDLVIKRARGPGDLAHYYMAGEYKPDVKDPGPGPASSFGRQALVTSVGTGRSSGGGHRRGGGGGGSGSGSGGGGVGGGVGGRRGERQRRGGATSPSYSMQRRWKPTKKVVDESYQPPLYSAMGTQLEGGFATAGAVPFASGRDRTYEARRELARAEEPRVGPQTYSPKLGATKPAAPAYSMAVGREDMQQKATNRGEVLAAVGSYELGPGALEPQIEAGRRSGAVVAFARAERRRVVCANPGPGHYSPASVGDGGPAPTMVGRNTMYQAFLVPDNAPPPLEGGLGAGAHREAEGGSGGGGRRRRASAAAMVAAASVFKEFTGADPDSPFM